MQNKRWLTLIGLVAGIAGVICAPRSDVVTAVVRVPRMAGDQAVRIVTNAALDEIVGRYDGTQNDCEIDLSRSILLYHESPKLLAPAYQRRIVACLREVGFAAQVAGARLNPPAAVPTVYGPIQLWPDRFTAVISVPAMRSHTDANIVANAIAYARLGKDDPRLSVDRKTRTLTATYNSLQLALKNIEVAIACAGFEANDIPANLGAADAVPHGWRPIKL
jgi:hypothetical protein